MSLLSFSDTSRLFMGQVHGNPGSGALKHYQQPRKLEGKDGTSC